MTAAFPPVSRLRPAVPAPSALPLRLGVLTPHNPYDRQSFSGTVFHAVEALGRHPGLRVRILGPHQPQSRLRQMFRRASPRFGPDALQASDFHGLDAVVGLVASPLLDRAAALTKLPLLHVTDATPGFLRNVYGRDVPDRADALEARVLDRALPIYSSRYMAERAKAEFGLPQARALCFGVNLSAPVQDLAPKPGFDRVELLYVGGNWDRKGGAIALEATRRLHLQGRPVRLTMVGTVPKPIEAALKGNKNIRLTGFLDKNRPRDAARLEALYAEAHVFVLPTRADCTPMVVAEALAHHTPVLATDVGGVAEMIGAGAGRTLPLDAGAHRWADAIADMTADPSLYAFMADAAGERTRVTLNWETWARGVADIASDAVLDRAVIAA